ncbi:MAG: type II toxin-antitoxin system VapC family toxin [Chloroflexota bacterium]
MTRPIVLDASAGVPLVRAEPESARWRAITDRWLHDGRPIVVPAHFWLELGNALMRRHHFSSAAVFEALHGLDDLVTETVELSRPTLLLAIDRAERFGLSVYDAGYLALAEVLDAELATMDRALERAAGPRLVERADHRPRLSETAAPYESPNRVTWPDYAGAASYLASLRARFRQAQSRPATEVR